jgi:tRNA dimethylallyltransferase
MATKKAVKQVHTDKLAWRFEPPAKTVVYRELFDFIDGKTDLETAIELIKQNSRRYAKRQLTWLKRHENATIVTFDKTASMLNHILSTLNALENSEKNSLE